MNRSYTRFIIHIFIFGVILLLFDRIVGTIENYLYLSNDNVLAYVASNKNQHEDIVIMGSSRARHHYIPKIIGDSTNMSCINIGVDGQNIYYHYALLNLLLKHQTPKIVIYELFNIDIERTQQRYSTEQLDKLAPVYGLNHSVDSIVALKGKKYIYGIEVFDSFRYNSRIFELFTSSDLTGKNKGYEPIYGVWSGDMKTDITFNGFDGDKLKCLYDFIGMCKSKGIEIMVFVSPRYINPDIESEAYITVGRECISRGAKFYYYENAQSDISNFKDINHLNDKGAQWYSALISREIRSLCKIEQ